jgi:hypothetical protein
VTPHGVGIGWVIFTWEVCVTTALESKYWQVHEETLKVVADRGEFERLAKRATADTKVDWRESPSSPKRSLTFIYPPLEVMVVQMRRVYATMLNFLGENELGARAAATAGNASSVQSRLEKARIVSAISTSALERFRSVMKIVQFEYSKASRKIIKDFELWDLEDMISNLANQIGTVAGAGTRGVLQGMVAFIKKEPLISIAIGLGIYWFFISGAAGRAGRAGVDIAKARASG